jgi:bud emergence protein 1
VEAALEDGRHFELSRYYEDFYDFQIALLTEFPAEAGNTGTQKRTLPYMPGPVNYITDAITEARRHNLDAYVKNLLTQPPYISRCSLVKQFFAPRDGDFEIDPNADYDESQPSSGGTPPESASRQSSRGNLNGNGYGGLSAAPTRQRSPNGIRSRAEQVPDLKRQSSALSTTSNSLQNGNSDNAAAEAKEGIRVKLTEDGSTYYAIKLPLREGTWVELWTQIDKRWTFRTQPKLWYSLKDPPERRAKDIIDLTEQNLESFLRQPRRVINVGNKPTMES